VLSYRIPAVMAGKDIFNGIPFCLLAAELTAPPHTGSGICTRACVPVFCITGTFLIGRIIPVVPPFGQNMIAEFTPHEECCGKRTPWPAKVYPFNAVGSSEPAPVENISGFLVLNR